MLAGGRGVLGVYYLLENIIHYYYCQSEGREDSSQGGEDFPLPPPLEIPCCHRFIKILKKPKAIYSPGFFFGVRKNVLRKIIHLNVNRKRN